MLYRIYTENKNYDSLVRLTSNLFPAFTITRGIGVWEGTAEQSAVIEIAEVGQDSGSLENRVLTLAENIRAENEQDAVLVVSIPATGILVTRHDKIVSATSK